MGRPNAGLTQHHLTVWFYPCEWDRMKYLSSSSGKTLSKWIEDKLISYIDTNGLKEPENIERDKSVTGKMRPLSFSEAGYVKIQSVVKKIDVTMASYIINIVFSDVSYKLSK